MKNLLWFLFLSCFTYSLVSAQVPPIRCLIETEIGAIEMELYQEQAPLTVQNFLQYVRNEAYENSSFFRVCTPENESEREVKIEVIQGGDVPENHLLPPINLETTEKTGILHKDGVVSMARLGPDSAQSSFFICIGDQPELDYQGKRNPDGQGFAAFGKVTKGMDLVKKIQSMDHKDQYLVEPVLIKTIRVINKF
jgi:peptidyl-prolyl cis-trans isomerase A (cyclophilin A)